MAQARRTGQKRDKRAVVNRAKAPSSQQWGLLLIVLLSGVAIGALLFGYGPWGQGLKNYRQKVMQQPSGQNAAKQGGENQAGSPSTALANTTQRTEKEFTFYNVLENDIGRVLPDDFPATDTERDKKKYRYTMQLASFKSIKGAQKLRARLALKGIETQVENKQGNFRITMGPFNSRRTLKNVRNKVKAAGLGLKPIAIQYRIGSN